MNTIINTHNPRTAGQNRHLYWLFGQLNIKSRDEIANIMRRFTEGRTSKTSELQFIECQYLIKHLSNILRERETHLTQSGRIDAMPDGASERKALDQNRKGVIKAIFRWGELQGYRYTMKYAIGIACRAAGVKRFNSISPAGLTRIYYEFCGKQKALEEKNRNYQPFCLN